MTEPDAAPTHDLAIERTVLGAMLEHPGEIPTITQIITAEDFYRPLHATIFTATVAAHAEGITGAILINRRLLDAGALINPADRAYLAELVGQAALPGATSHYAETLVELAARRRLAVSLARMDDALRRGADAAQLDHLAGQITEAARPRLTDDRMIRIGELIDGGLSDIEHRREREAGLKTGFHDLDRILAGGLRGGEMVVVAGRPGMGKSTLAMDVSRYAAIRRKLTVAFFSLEMQATQLFDRVLSAEASVPHHLIRTGHLRDDDWARSGTAVGEMAEAPLYLRCGPTPMRLIANHCRKLQAQVGLDLAVVDYVQIVPPERRTSSREQEVAETARQIKLLALELDCPIVAVAQLNRNSEHRTDKRPQLADLRESGELEQAADIVLFVHRDDRYDKESPRAGEVDLILAKNRSGAEEVVTLAAQLHYTRFANMGVDS
jgi:replicative DNA helicase